MMINKSREFDDYIVTRYSLRNALLDDLSLCNHLIVRQIKMVITSLGYIILWAQHGICGSLLTKTLLHGT
jgi:hypothetical protein